VSFCYQAIDASGRAVSATIDAASVDEAIRSLRSKGLLVTQMSETTGPSAPEASGRAFHLPWGHGGKSVRWKEIVYFTQQMAMLLGSGARIVPTLRAVEAQSRSEAMKSVLRRLRDRVEDGVPLNVAMADHPQVFNGVFRSLIAAGESTGRMPQAFEQLAAYTRQQQEVRQRVLGAMAYPALLTCMCAVILTGLFTFVLPRFRELFTTLGVELPPSTRILMDVSQWAGAHWILIVGGLGTLVGALVAAFRSAAGRRWWAGAYTQIPLAGRLIRRLILARMFRIWGVLVTNNLGLIEAIRMAKGTTRSTLFHSLMDAVEQAVTDGRLVGSALHESPLIPPTMAAAVATGEESGRLGASLLFIADALESENSQMLASLSRIIEPIILVGLGGIVGLVAVSLFMPMFDIATIAGGG
jgi:type IV pilus assembly protein PilC